MANVNVNALTNFTTPAETDKFVAVNANTNEGKIIGYNDLSQAMLNNETYSDLETTDKTVIGAINEANNGVRSWNGMSGDVTYTAPVRSVNGKTGDVIVSGGDSSAEFAGCVIVDFGTISSLPATIENESITATMVCVESVLGNPSAQTSEWTVTTTNDGTNTPSVTISGTISGETSIVLYLADTIEGTGKEAVSTLTDAVNTLNNEVADIKASQKVIKTTRVSGTTSTSGLLATEIDFDKVITTKMATTGVQYYTVIRKATNGTCAIFVFDNTFTAVKNTAVAVDVVTAE